MLKEYEDVPQGILETKEQSELITTLLKDKKFKKIVSENLIECEYKIIFAPSKPLKINKSDKGIMRRIFLKGE